MLKDLTFAHEDREEGFSLVELLVVIVIIGILSAIAIGAFLNQRKKANDAAVESDLRTVVTTIETMIADHPQAQTVRVEAVDSWTPEELQERGYSEYAEHLYRHNTEYEIAIYNNDKAYKSGNGKVEPDAKEVITLSEGVFIQGTLDAYSLHDGYTIYASHWNGDKYLVDQAGANKAFAEMVEQGMDAEEASNIVGEKYGSGRYVYDSTKGFRYEKLDG